MQPEMPLHNVISLDYGHVDLFFPKRMSVDDVNDLEEALRLFINIRRRQALRAARALAEAEQEAGEHG